MEDTKIAELSIKGTTYAIVGKANGRTILHVRYFGSPAIRHRNEVLDVDVLIPVSVGDTFELEPKEVNLQINQDFTWKVTISNPPASYFTRWDFGDGSGMVESIKNNIRLSNEVKMTYRYQKPGTFTIQVFLVDGSSNKTITYAKGTATVAESVAAFPKYISFGIYLYNEYNLSNEQKTIRSEIAFNLNSKDDAVQGKLSWSGKTFTYVIDQNKDGTSLKLTLTGTLSGDYKTMNLRMDMTAKGTSERLKTPIQESMSFEFRNLPVETFHHDDKTFRMQNKGESLKNYLTTFKHDYQFEDLSVETGKYYIGTGKYSYTIWDEDSAIGCYGFNQ